jgi:hypothetical protein
LDLLLRCILCWFPLRKAFDDADFNKDGYLDKEDTEKKGDLPRVVTGTGNGEFPMMIPNGKHIFQGFKNQPEMCVVIESGLPEKTWLKCPR